MDQEDLWYEKVEADKIYTSTIGSSFSDYPFRMRRSWRPCAVSDLFGFQIGNPSFGHRTRYPSFRRKLYLHRRTRSPSRQQQPNRSNWELYETADFSLQIPKGWTVTSGGTGMYHSIRVQDPAEPLNQIFVLLKADVLLHSQEGKDAGLIIPGFQASPNGRYLPWHQSCQPPLLRTFLKFFRSMQILLCRLSRVILAIPSPGLKDLLSPSVSRQPAV